MFRVFRYTILTTFFLSAGLFRIESFATETVDQYDLYEKTINVTLPYGNPFDSADIKVDAEFLSPYQNKITVPCFHDGEQGWKLRFTPIRTGHFDYRIIAQNPQESQEILTGSLDVRPQDRKGFVRVGKGTSRHFVYDIGDSYFPVGENLGWVHPANAEGWKAYLDECQAAKINWIRIWISPIGSTELEWTPQRDRYHGLGKYELRNARMMDDILQMAQERGIYIQLVINHHGQYSDKTNPMWDGNPYNSMNGGFLEKPGDFFTNEEALRHYQNRLRYMVARWGYSTHLMAWEFWNEVDLTGQYQADTVKAWHERVIPLLRELDPYDHLLTTSAASDHKTVYNINGLDFVQTHAYINRIIQKIEEVSRAAAREQPQKPHFFGELSYDYRGPNKGDREGVILHKQLWASVHSHDAGTAMTWWWDNWVRPYNLYSHFQRIAEYVEGIHWDRENLQPLTAKIEPQPKNRCDLMIYPPMEWAETQTAEFRISADGHVEDLRGLSCFVHGQNHREMAPNPTFEIERDRPTEFGLKISRVSKSGAHCIIERNGEVVYEQGFDSGEKDSTMGDVGKVTILVPAGKNRISIRNTGQDWFSVQYYWVTDLAERLAAYTRGNKERILIWVNDRPHEYALLDRYETIGFTVPTTLTLPEIPDGEYNLERFDPYTGEITPLPNPVAASGGLKIEIPAFRKDIAFRLRRQ